MSANRKIVRIVTARNTEYVLGDGIDHAFMRGAEAIHVGEIVSITATVVSPSDFVIEMKFTSGFKSVISDVVEVGYEA